MSGPNVACTGFVFRREHADAHGQPFWVYTRPEDAGRGGGEPSCDLSPDPAGPDVLDKVYRALLRGLSVTARHAKQLQQRGLPPAEQKKRGYRALDKQRCNAVRGALEHGVTEAELAATPGVIISEKDGRRYWSLASYGGLVIPVRDAAKRIVALLVRLDSPGRGGKYSWLSSAGKDRGGASPGSPLHFPLFDGDRSVVRLTEGALKADVATVLSDVLTLGLSGHDAWRRGVEAAQEVGAKTVRCALDADWRTNPAVARSLAGMFRGVQDAGLGAVLELWEPDDGKGIDDVLAAGKPVRVLAGDEALAAVAEIEKVAGRAARQRDLAPARDADGFAEGGVGAGPGIIGEFDAEDDPHLLARKHLGMHQVTDDYLAADALSVRYWRGEFYEWHGDRYQEANLEQVRARVTRSCKEWFDSCVRGSVMSGPDGKRKFVRKVTGKVTGNVLGALKSLVLVPGAVEQPAWLCPDPPFPADEALACTNGIVHLPSLAAGTPRVVPLTPALFSTNAVGYAFDPAAPAPAENLKFYRQLWRPFDVGTVYGAHEIDALLEWYGYFLTADTSQQKILLVVGPTRAGKGLIADVLEALVGKENVAYPSLADLEAPFGLKPLLGKRLAIIREATVPLHGDPAVLAERLKGISGEDPQSVNRKNKDHLHVRLGVRFVLMANEVPRFVETSGALAGRIIALRMTGSWKDREDLTLKKRLLAELPGLLLWSARGLARLRERGRFEQPPGSAEAVEQLREMASPVTVFVEERCERGPLFRESKGVLYTAFGLWCRDEGIKQPPTASVFFRNLSAAFPGLRTERPRGGGRVCCGIKLRHDV
jgi:putative DNA primase/helicase